MNPIPLSRRTPLAFTLVEVALALGILSFALVAILALVPVALRGSRDSIEKGLELEMVQTARARLISLPYTALPDSGVLYFTPEGVETTETGDVRYRLEFTNEADTALPGGQTAANVRTARLRILNTVTNRSGTACLYLPDNGL